MANVGSRTYEKFKHQPCYNFAHKCKGCGRDFHGLKRRNFCTHICALKNGIKRGWRMPGREAIISPAMKDIYWAAGIYEGEGSAYRNGSNGITVSVSQKDLWLLHRMKELFGGALYLATHKKANTSEWVIHGSRARGFAMTIYSLLSPRRQEQLRAAGGFLRQTQL